MLTTPQAGDEIATHPAHLSHVLPVLTCVGELAVVYHRDAPGAGPGRLILWRALDGLWSAKVACDFADQPQNADMVHRAQVWVERELATQASSWGAEHEGQFRLIYCKPHDGHPAHWRGAHLDEQGHARLFTWPKDTAAAALQALENCADVVEVSDMVAAELNL